MWINGDFMNYELDTEMDVKLVSLTKSINNDTLDDTFFAKIARISYMNHNDNKSYEDDIRLMKYLLKNNHMSPFEHVSFTFLIECPLFISKQIMRHRTFSYNEVSRRYTTKNIKFYLPRMRKKAQKNKQGSLDEIIQNEEKYKKDYIERLNDCHYTYQTMLKNGIAPEVARMILPQSLYTQFYMSGNLRNFIHFLELRMDSHAQKEIRIIATKIHEILKSLFPETISFIFNKKEECEK